MNSTLPQHEIVLLGAGHTNSHVLRMWKMAPLAGARLTCVSNFSIATYSGMLPGALAGLYLPERMQIDLVRFCAAAGVRLLTGRVTGLDLTRRRLLFDDRPELPFDVLSIGIGSVPKDDAVDEGAAALAIKPMQTFLPRLDERVDALRASVADRPLRLAVVGGGAGGVEISFCLPFHLRKRWPGLAFELDLIDKHGTLPHGADGKTAAVVRRELERRGVRLKLGRSVAAVAGGELTFDDGARQPIDLALWATSARGPSLLAGLGLPVDERGFLLTRTTLQTTAEAPVFVVGDSGTSLEHPAPKAGVYAVRQGPILWENLQRTLSGRSLVEYVPQRGFLSLLATGDRRAVLSYKGFTAHAGWCWKLKDSIDSRFMAKYQDYRPMTPAAPPPAAALMRCAGCGGKLGGSILSRVLERLEIPPSEHVLLGLQQPDDAAIVQPPGGRPLAATIDFFTAFLDDPYLVGRVAALNALSDLYAIRAAPLAAMAMATLPLGPPRARATAVRTARGRAARTTTGGSDAGRGAHDRRPQHHHRLLAAGRCRRRAPPLKSGLRTGDLLVLTKPLGSGILLAAHMQARCRAAWMDALIPVLLASNQPAAEVARRFDIAGATDVTGFGLAGHLLEMLHASQAAAEVRLDALPLLPGVAELVAEGVESTLAPANREAESEIENVRALDSAPHAAARTFAAAYSSLFDPQTSGGLLLGVRPDQAEQFAAQLRRGQPLLDRHHRRSGPRRA